MMSSAQVQIQNVSMMFSVNSPSQDYTQPDDHSVSPTFRRHQRYHDEFFVAQINSQ